MIADAAEICCQTCITAEDWSRLGEQAGGRKYSTYVVKIGVSALRVLEARTPLNMEEAEAAFATRLEYFAMIGF